MCRQLLPAERALTEEEKDYRLWFCRRDCHAQWRREHADVGNDRES